MHGLIASAAGSDWPLVRGDASGTGVAVGKLPAEPKVLWEYKTGDDKAGFEGTPIIADGKVLVGDFEGNVHAIDLQTGKNVWKAKGKEGFTAAGAVSNGMFVIGDFSSNIYCFRVSDGEQVWAVESEQQVINGGNFIGDDVLLSSDSGTFSRLISRQENRNGTLKQVINCDQVRVFGKTSPCSEVAIAGFTRLMWRKASP